MLPVFLFLITTLIEKALKVLVSDLVLVDPVIVHLNRRQILKSTQPERDRAAGGELHPDHPAVSLASLLHCHRHRAIWKSGTLHRGETLQFELPLGVHSRKFAVADR